MLVIEPMRPVSAPILYCAAETGESADERDVSTQAERAKRLRQRVLPADFEHVRNAGAASGLAHFLVPLGMSAIVDRRRGAD